MRFRFFGIPVELRPGLLLFAGIMAFVFRQSLGAGPERFFGFVLLVASAVFLHELGHALAGKALGLEPSMDLGFRIGGTWFGASRTLSRAQRIAIVLAGPAASFLAATFAFVGRILGGPGLDATAAALLDAAMLTNLTVGIGHLLPVHPTDGSALIAELVDTFRPGRGRAASIGVSIGLFLALFAYLLVRGQYLLGALVVFFAFRQRAQLYALDEAAAEEAATSPRERALRALTQRQSAKVVRHAQDAEREAKTVEDLDEARYLLAWGHFLSGNARAAREALDGISPARPRDFALEGAVAHDLGDHEGSLELFERALPKATRFVEPRMIHAILETRRFEEAAALFADTLGARFSTASLATVQRAAFEAGDDVACTGIASSLHPRTEDASAAFLAACASSRSGHVDAALAWLRRARDRGLDAANRLDEEPTLEAVRARPEWAPLRASFERSSQPDGADSPDV